MASLARDLRYNGSVLTVLICKELVRCNKQFWL